MLCIVMHINAPVLGTYYEDSLHINKHSQSIKKIFSTTESM